MKKYMFLTDNYSEGQDIYYAIHESEIETLFVSHTYVNGQLISDSDAGDYITINSENAVKIANDAYNEYYADDADDEREYVEKFSIGDIISAYDFANVYSNVRSACEENIDYTDFRTTCRGFNYFDGNNWQTITVACEFGETSHKILDDKDLIHELNEAIEKREFEAEGFGKKIYTAGDYVVVDDYCQGKWASYKVMTKEDYEFYF